MNGSHPSQPNSQEIFSETQRPIAHWFGNGVDGGSRAGFGAVRGERNASGEKCGGPTPFFTRRTSGSVREDGSCGRTDEGVHGIPDGVDVWNFVGEKLDEIQRDRQPDNPRTREHVEGAGQVQNAESFKKPERCHGGIKIQTGGEAGAEG